MADSSSLVEPKLFQNPIRKARFGLTAKYLLHLSGVGILLSLMLVANASYQLQKAALTELEQRAGMLSENLASACNLRYLLGDLESIRYLFTKSKELEDVNSIFLIDPTGKVELNVGRSQVAHPPVDIRGIAKLQVWRDQNLVHALAPLLIQRNETQVATGMLAEPESAGANNSSDLLGYIYLTMSLEKTNEFLKILILRSIAAMIIIILFGSAIAFYFFQKTVLHPIQKLVEAMTAVQKGHLDMSLEGMHRSDEIGSLTLTFNEMTRNLYRTEEALKQANSDLENRVLARTWDLEHAMQKLKDTQDKVVRSEKLAAIGQLASSVGHELRNPLGAIRNAIYYVRDAMKESSLAKEDQNIVEFLDLADTEIKSATTIIADLLDFARVIKLNKQEMDLQVLFQEVKRVVDIPPNVQLIEDYDPETPQLKIDPVRIKQVFINLMTNAIQAMPNGGVLKVRIGREQDGPDPGKWINIYFKDSGIGMDENTLNKIFQPLFTTKSKGTGLGLAVTQGVVEAHGGKISVRSQLEKGSEFIVQLPLQVNGKEPTNGS